MRKILLYLYPSYDSFANLQDECYSLEDIKKKLKKLDETINRRYRQKGYEVTFVLEPNTEVYGLTVSKEDATIYYVTGFNYYEIGDYSKLYDSIGHIDELVVSGHRSLGHVEKAAEYASSKEIDTMVDLELTENFFYDCDKADFNMDKYNPTKYKNLSIYKNPIFRANTNKKDTK